MIKSFFFFKPDVLVMAKDIASKSVTDSVLYKSIKCINLLGTTTLYFKSNKDGFALFFKNFNPENAKKWFKYLIMCKEKTDEAKVDIQPADISEHIQQWTWDSKEVMYRFNYMTEIGDKKDTRSSENPSPGEIWIPEVD